MSVATALVAALMMVTLTRTAAADPAPQTADPASPLTAAPAEIRALLRVRELDVQGHSTFVDLTQRAPSGGVGAVEFVSVIPRRPPPGLAGYFVLRAAFDCPGGRSRSFGMVGYDRDDQVVAGEARQIEISDTEVAPDAMIGFACSLATPEVSGEVFTSSHDAAASVWARTNGDGLDAPAQFHFSFVGDGGDPDNPMYAYVDRQTVHRGADGRVSAWVIYVWRHPAPWPDQDLLSQYMLSLKQYDCSHSQHRRMLEYGRDGRTGRTLYQGGVGPFTPISRYSSDEDELRAVCGPARGGATRASVGDIAGAVADVARRSRGGH